MLMFLLPILLIVLGSFANQIDAHTTRIGILMEEDKNYYKELSSIYDEADGIQYEIADTDSVHTDLITGQYQFVIDFRNTKKITDFAVISYYNLSKEKTMESLKTSLETKTPFHLQERQGKGITATARFAAFLLTLLMITATLNSSSLIRDRKEGTMVRYRYSPQKVSSYVSGNLAYNMLLTALQIGISFLFIKLFQLPVSLTVKNILIISSIIVGAATSFGMCITLLSNSDMKANIAASSIAILFSIIGGTFVPYERMPGILKVISMVSPVRWIIEIAKSMEQSISTWKHSIPYIIMLGFILLLYSFSFIQIYRKK